MEQKAILLNGGHDHEVECLDGADPFLARLLGAAPSLPACPFLRTVQDPDGQQAVGVFIGSRHVGYLPRPVDEGLLATLQACEMNEAVARARGYLIASWDCPGKVKIRISLADAEHLLRRPEAEPEVQPVTVLESDMGERTSTNRATSTLSASIEDSTAFALSSEAAGPSSPFEHTPDFAQSTFTSKDPAGSALSAGWTGDYPDWPPPRSDSAASTELSTPTGSPVPAEPLAPVDPTLDDERAVPLSAPAGSFFAPAAPRQAPDVPQPEPSAQQAPSDVSTEALLSTRSAWVGREPGQTRTPQSGWLGSTTVKSPQGPSTDAMDTDSVGTATPAGPVGPAGPGGLVDAAAGPSPDEEIVAAWTSTPPTPQPAATPTPIKPRAKSRGIKTWLFSALAVVLLLAVALVVWKFVFAPKTYADQDYGYSFSYPNRWDLVDDVSMQGAFGNLADSSGVLNLAMAGHGFDSNHPNDVALIEVARIEADTPIQASQLLVEMQTYYAQAQRSGILQVEEPVASATLAGLDGCRVKLTVPTNGYSLTGTCYFLTEGTGVYVLLAGATPGLWSESQKAFDAFFDTFKPGGTKM
jgi:hypothetical protein